MGWDGLGTRGGGQEWLSRDSIPKASPAKAASSPWTVGALVEKL